MTERERKVVSTIQYNKLVRDHIPEIIEASGKRCVCATLSDEGYLAKLDEKLSEELAEYQESKSMEEVEAIRRDKAAKRGGFEKRILLSEVITKE